MLYSIVVIGSVPCGAKILCCCGLSWKNPGRFRHFPHMHLARSAGSRQERKHGAQNHCKFLHNI